MANALFLFPAVIIVTLESAVWAEIGSGVGLRYQSLLEPTEETPIDQIADNSVEAWDPPDEVRREFPYYVSGFDKQRRPILVIEIGRWKWEAVAEKGGEELEILERHVSQIYSRIERWASRRNGVAIIFDFEDFGFKRIASHEAIAVLIRLFHKLAGLREDRIAFGFCVNVNYVAGIYINLAKAFLGNLLSKFEFYGTHSEQWIPRLQEKIGRSQLPPWYGGVKNFKPVAVYGR